MRNNSVSDPRRLAHVAGLSAVPLGACLRWTQEKSQPCTDTVSASASSRSNSGSSRHGRQSARAAATAARSKRPR